MRLVLHCLMSMNKNSGDGNARPGRLEALRILVQKPSKEVLIKNLFKALKIIWVRNDILVPTLAQDYFQFYCCGPQLKRWFFMTLFFSTGIFTSIEAHLATQFLSIYGCLV